MADVRVKDSDWNSLPPDMQAQIQSIVSQQVPGTNIVPDSGGIALTSSIGPDEASGFLALAAGPDPDCVANCNSARDIAMAACATLGDPKVIAACMVITQIAAAICRATC